MAERRDTRAWRRRHRVAVRDSWRQTIMPAVLLFALLGTVAGGGWLWWRGNQALVPTDATTLCATDRPPTEIHVVLLDMSDAFTEAQRLQVENSLGRLKSSIPRLGRIEVFRVTGAQDRVITPVFTVCNPGDGREVNQLYQNPTFATAKWNQFSSGLNTQLATLMASPSTPTSQIMEAIQATALRTFGRPEFQGIPKRLTVVSDLLQNVPGGFSQYEDVGTFASFERTAYFNRVRADLTGVKVTCLYLVRPGAPQKWPEHYVFWEQFFKAQGGEVGTIDPIYGAK